MIGGGKLECLKELMRRNEFRCAIVDCIGEIVGKGMPIAAKLLLFSRLELRPLVIDAFREFIEPDGSLRRARDESELLYDETLACTLRTFTKFSLCRFLSRVASIVDRVGTELCDGIESDST